MAEKENNDDDLAQLLKSTNLSTSLHLLSLPSHIIHHIQLHLTFREIITSVLSTSNILRQRLIDDIGLGTIHLSPSLRWSSTKTGLGVDWTKFMNNLLELHVTGMHPLPLFDLALMLNSCRSTLHTLSLSATNPLDSTLCLRELVSLMSFDHDAAVESPLLPGRPLLLNSLQKLTQN